jgi:glycosyltransferase involved in cell wall biosynthesis
MNSRAPFVLHIITGLADGGAEAVLYRLCTHDTKNRHVVVSLMDAGKYGPLLQTAGVEVHCLHMPRGRVTAGGLWRLWRLLRTQRPSVVQTWMYHADLVGGVLARLAGVPALCWGIHNTSLEPGSSTRSTIWVARICAWLSRWLPRAIVSCSRESVRVHRALGYAARKFFVIPNGYDLTRFAPDAAARVRLRAEWGIEDETPLIGMVARFDPQKDHATLIDALARLAHAGSRFACVLVGTGVDPGNAALREAIAAAGLETSVRLVGRRDDVPAVMNALDVHVLSSRSEAFPNVLAEAMACGTPCVTTDVGDAALIVGDTGWVVPPRDPDALARALAEALAAKNDSAAWQARKCAARERVATHFDIERMVDSYRSVWQRVQQGAPVMASEQETE